MRRLLLPLSSLYGAGVALRLALYRRGVLAVRSASRPVVSIGNVAAGGPERRRSSAGSPPSS
jgi:tetraacyldisaccharide 4'-kinase